GWSCRTPDAGPPARSGPAPSCPWPPRPRRRCAPCALPGPCPRDGRPPPSCSSLLLLVWKGLRARCGLRFDPGLLRRVGQRRPLLLAPGLCVARLGERLLVSASQRDLELPLRLSLPEQREHPVDVVADLLDPHRVVELARGELEAQVEQLLLERLHPLQQFLVRELAQLRGSFHSLP